MINLQQIVVDSWLDEKVSCLVTTAELPAFKNEDLHERVEVVKSFAINHPEYSAVIFASRSGITEIASVGEVGFDISDREYYYESLKGNKYISDVLIGHISKKPIITVSTPVYNYADEYLGVLFATIPVENIDNIMDQFAGNSRETYLVDNKGMLITQSRQGQVGEYINSIAYKNALENEQITKMYQTNTGEYVLGNYRWVGDNRWLIIGEITRNEIYKPLIRMASLYLIELVFLAGIGLLFISWLSNQLSRSIQTVLKGTREIGEGSFGYRIDRKKGIYDAIEFQQLSNNFNNMAYLIEENILSLAESEQRFRMISDYSSDIITIHNELGQYLYISAAGKEILGYDEADVIGHDNMHFTHPDDLQKILAIQPQFKKAGYAVFTYRMRCKDGTYIWLESSAKRLQSNELNKSRTIVISRNITERKLAEEKLSEANKLLEELSMKDGLLGIWNRRAFDKQLVNEWNRSIREDTPISLLMIDIDHFKAYNDTYGHQQGDECLKKIANIISHSVKRAADLVYRYGGEEFAVILVNTDQKGAKIVAENIRRAVEDAQIPHSGSLVENYVTISIGINTMLPSKSLAVEQLIDGADKALYKSKKAGRNQSCNYRNDA